MPGNPELVAEYRNTLYYLETEEKREKFMRSVCYLDSEEKYSALMQRSPGEWTALD